MDADGDGLERILLDEDGHVVSCIDGDGTPIPGSDCFLDPRMADGFSVNFSLRAITARYAGREPGWQHAVAGTCEAGMPEHSLFGDVVHEGPCVSEGQRCDPLVAVPCCDPDRVCQGPYDDTYRCSGRCTATECDAGGRPGVCLPGGGCFPIGREHEHESCALGAEGCETEQGLREGTLCVPWDSSHICLEGCEPEPTGCDVASQACFPLVLEEGGFCHDGA